RLLFLAIPRDKWPSVIKELARVTKPGGYIQVVEFGWNGPIGKLCLADVRGIFAGLKPFVLSKARMTDEEYEQLCIDAAKDSAWSLTLLTANVLLASEENLIYMNAFSVTARVPEL
ncbi:hypothetical protein HK405_011408, partial [Cladochytrium tenue]